MNDQFAIRFPVEENIGIPYNLLSITNRMSYSVTAAESNNRVLASHLRSYERDMKDYELSLIYVIVAIYLISKRQDALAIERWENEGGSYL